MGEVMTELGEGPPDIGGGGAGGSAANLRTDAFVPKIYDPTSIEGLRLTLSWVLVGTGREWSRLLDDRLRMENQTRPRWRVLAWTRLLPGITQTEMAERMGISGPALVGILDGLVRLGLVERRSGEQDRRVNEIYLTDRAEPVIERITTVAATIRDQLLEDIGEDELRSFLSVLDRIRSRLKQL
jgi:MarR family transcriptional regulator for hemolysin